MKLLIKTHFLTVSLFLLASVFHISVFAQMSQEDLNQWLLNASASGDSTSVQLLLEKDVDVNVTNENGCSPLMYAFGYYECSSNVDYYDIVIIGELVDAGAELSSQEQLDHFLLKSVAHGIMRNVVRAIDMGADVNVESIGFMSSASYSKYRSPLIQASYNCRDGIARYLLINGASINNIEGWQDFSSVEGIRHTVTDTRETALDVAIENCDSDSNIVRLLQDVGGVSAQALPPPVTIF